MNFRSKLLLIIFAAVILTYNSCKQKEEYPVIPYIQFKSFVKINNSSGKDDKGILTISFTDGDGDIGLSQSDTLPPFDSKSEYYYNFITKYFEQQNDTLIEVTFPDTLNARIPVITPKGNNKNIKGEIEIKIFINNTRSKFDTIAFEVYIYDRALHKSNVITTPRIIINK